MRLKAGGSGLPFPGPLFLLTPRESVAPSPRASAASGSCTAVDPASSDGRSPRPPPGSKSPTQTVGKFPRAVGRATRQRHREQCSGTGHDCHPVGIVIDYMPTLPKPNPVLVAFETRTSLGPTFAARLLGMEYPTYAQYRSGRRPLKDTTIRHIDLLLFLTPAQLQEWIERHGTR